MATCEKLGIPAALERSRSGNCGHIWLFFAEAVPASHLQDPHVSRSKRVLGFHKQQTYIVTAKGFFERRAK